MQHSWYNSTLFYQQDKKNAKCCCSVHFCFPMRETRHRFACGKYLEGQTAKN